MVWSEFTIYEACADKDVIEAVIVKITECAANCEPV